MHELTILYEEEKYSSYWQNKPIRALIIYIAVFLIPGILLSIGLYFMVIKGVIDYDLVAIIVLYVAGTIVAWWTTFRIYWVMHKTYRNPVKVKPTKIEIGKLFEAPIDDIDKSIYNVSTGTLYIYLKNGKKFRIVKDISKISWWGEKTHFSYTEYGDALKKLGIPFEVVRRKGLFGVEPVRGREAYKEIRHRERYEKWIKRQQKEDGENLKIEGGDV